MWSTVDHLLGRGHRACDRVSADELSRFFANMVEQIRSTTSGSSPPTYSPVPPGVSFTEFTSVSLDDVATAVAGLPDKSSALDPIPVPVLKAVSDLLAPFLAYLFNISLSSGRVPATFKDSFVTPVIKKPASDEATRRSTGRYRIYPSFPRLWNVSSRDNWCRTSTPTDFYQRLNPVSGEDIRQRPPQSTSCQIFLILSAVATLLFSSC